jgi:hypothetical protein
MSRRGTCGALRRPTGRRRRTVNALTRRRVSGTDGGQGHLAGFTWYSRVLPTDVSFRYIWVGEGPGDTEADGGLEEHDGWHHFSWSVPANVGCDNWFELVDGAYSGSVEPTGPGPSNLYEEGSFRIDIPWYWYTGLGTPSSGPFTTLTITSELAADGTMTHTKGAISFTLPFGPPAMGLPWNGATSPMFQEPGHVRIRCP